MDERPITRSAIVVSRESHAESRALSSPIDELYETHAPAVFGYARARVGPDDAEDVTAEVFVRALRTVMAGDASKVTPAWLMTVTKNCIIDRWRHQGHIDAHHARLAAEALRESTWPTEPADDAVIDALDYLSPLHRTVLLLKYVDGYSVADIGELIGKSHAATESTLARAKRAFRSNYEVQSDG